MGLPGFVIIGGARCGTTSLHYYLDGHPEIFMAPQKDCRFFAMHDEPMPDYLRDDEPSRKRFESMQRGAVTDLDAYRALFEEATNEKAVGEASAFYLYHPRAPERMARYVPEARLIAVLRHPAERAFSHYQAQVRNGYLQMPFEEVLDAEDVTDERIWGGRFHFIRQGFYYRNLSRYYGRFRRAQLRVYLFDDLAKEPEGLVRDICRFLGVRDEVPLDVSHRYSVGGRARSQMVEKLVVRQNPLKRAVKWILPRRVRARIMWRVKERNAAQVTLDPELRQRLVDIFRPDILKLQDLIERDLSHWLR